MRQPVRLTALALTVVAACADPGPTGGLTARIEFGEPSAAGRSTRLLRAVAVPDVVDRLQILALNTDGSTLAETNLYANPSSVSQLQLFRAGGTWRLDGVPAGPNRTLAGRAYLAPNADPRLDAIVVFSGEIRGVEVTAGQTTDAGVLVLEPGPNRVPEADTDPPPPPRDTVAESRAGGEGLDVSWNPPDASDVAGYLVAASSMPTAGTPPTLAARSTWQVGALLNGSPYRVAAVLTVDQARQVALDDLENGVPVSVLVFAFDGTETGAPLNYGPAALVFGTPIDSVAPGPVGNLTAQIVADQVEVTFVAPGEDGASDSAGRPDRYEVRSANTADTLNDPVAFSAARSVGAPDVAAPGTTVRFSRPLAAFGLDTDVTRYIGIRAVDDSSNIGPVSVTAVSRMTAGSPDIVGFQPPHALGGLEIAIQGTAFGFQEGTVTLTGTESTTVSQSLLVLSWADDEILVRIPANAPTGEITVERTDGAAATAFLAVLNRVQGVLPETAPPFAFTALGPRGRVAALYREEGFFSVNAAMERFVDNLPEGVLWSPAQPDERAQAMVSAQTDQRFIFGSYTSDGQFEVALLGTSTIAAADPFRLTSNLGAMPADSVSLAARSSVDDRVPALLAFTVQGTLRTGEVADARIDPFSVFVPVSSTVATFDAASIAVAQNGSAALVYRRRTATEARLALRRSTDGSAGGFVPTADAGPLAEARTLIRALPDAPDEFVIAYQEPSETGSRIRLLLADEFGTTIGIAPFAIADLRLADLGFVTARGELRIAVLGVRDGANTELRYTELPVSALSEPASVGQWPGAVMDVAAADTDARLGCTTTPADHCTIAWMGDSVGLLFVRR